MAAQYKHRRYFRVRGNTWNGISGSNSSLKVFTSTSDANTKIGFKSVYATSSPSKTEALADSDQTLVVTYEFNNQSDQDAFKAAVDGAYTESATPFDPATDTDHVEHFKTEWLNQDGSVGATYNNTTYSDY